MPVRLAVLAASVGVVIAAIAIVVTRWPTLPARTLPRPVTFVAMAGDPVGAVRTGCLAPMLAELRRRPSWTVRIDDMRWTDYTGPDEDPRHASIVLDAGGGIWRDDWLPQQALPLTAEEVRDVIAAFARSCEVDEALPRAAYEGRYIAVAYGAREPAAARLRYNSPVVVRLGTLFDAIRARYVTNRAGAARQFVLKLAGELRDGHEHWSKHAIVIDASAREADDAARVALVDWALALPHTLPPGRMTATGTLTLAGVTRPVAVALDASRPEHRGLRDLGLADELTMWMSINRP